MPTSHPHLKEARASEDRKVKGVAGEAVGKAIQPNEYGEKPASEDRAQQRARGGMTEGREKRLKELQEAKPENRKWLGDYEAKAARGRFAAQHPMDEQHR